MVGARDGAGVVLDIRPRWRTSTSEGPASSPRTVRWPWSSTVLGPNGFCPGFDEPGFDQIDVVIMESSSRRARIALSSLQSRHRVGLVLAASGLEGAILVKDSTELRLGDVLLHVTRRGAGLAVEITARGSFPEG